MQGLEPLGSFPRTETVTLKCRSLISKLISFSAIHKIEFINDPSTMKRSKSNLLARSWKRMCLIHCILLI